MTLRAALQAAGNLLLGSPASVSPAKSLRGKPHLVTQDKKPGWRLGVRNVFEKLQILIAGAVGLVTLCKKEGSDSCICGKEFKRGWFGGVERASRRRMAC